MLHSSTLKYNTKQPKSFAETTVNATLPKINKVTYSH